MKDTVKPEPTRRRGAARQPEESSGGINIQLGGMLGKLGGLVEKLADLAATGKEFSRTGAIEGLDPNGKLRGVYGVSVKFGLGEHGENELKVEPFGNIRREANGDAVVDDVREPLVELYEEEDHLLILAEIPGVSKKQVQIDVADGQMTISARRRETRYRKQITLPEGFDPQHMQWDCKNGILQVRIERA